MMFKKRDGYELRQTTRAFHPLRFAEIATCTMLQRQRGGPSYDSTETTKNYSSKRLLDGKSGMTLYSVLNRIVRDDDKLA